MYYGQKNYPQQLGTGPSTIKEAGCLLISFCNLFKISFDHDIDPLTLNNELISSGGFSGDIIKGWGVVTLIDPDVHVVSSAVGATHADGGQDAVGWPETNDAVVEFNFISPNTGVRTTHYCRIADHSEQTIVDSYDGVIRKPGYYGSPVAYATFAKNSPLVVTPVQPISAAGPAAQPEETFTVEDIAPKKISLKLDPTHLWNLQETNWPAMGANPVSSSPVGTVVDVSQVAHHKLGGTYYMVGDSSGYNIVDCEDYTPPEVPVVPAPAPTTEEGVFTAFDSPMNLVANKDAEIFDTATGKAVSTIVEGEDFTAVGKITMPNKDVYFVPTATTTLGVNTVDLSVPSLDTAPAKPVEDAGEQVPVKVLTPADPNNWQASFTANLGPVAYIATRNAVISDLAGVGVDTQLVRGQVVKVAGCFEKDGVKYYRTVHSVANDTWYGLPEGTLTKESDIKEDGLIETTLKEADKLRREAGFLNPHDKALATAASVEGFLSKLIHRKNK